MPATNGNKPTGNKQATCKPCSTLLCGFVVILALLAPSCSFGAQTETIADSTADRTEEVPVAPSNVAVEQPSSPLLTPEYAAPHALYLKVRLPASTPIAAFRPGQTVDAELAQAVYSGTQELFPPASRMVLTVRGIERCRRSGSSRWPWMVAVFRPRHENCPTFESGRVSLADGREVPLQLSLISIAREKHVLAKPGPKEPSAVPSTATSQDPRGELRGTAGALPAETRGQRTSAPAVTLTFEAVELADGADSPGVAQMLPTPDGPPTLAPGTQAKVILLSSLSASKNHRGDTFQARLIEPVHAGTTAVLPEGALLEGNVTKVVRPRWLSRSGTLLLTFNRLVLPAPSPMNVSASVTGAQLDQNARINIDAEGGLRGARPGKLWTLINLGTTAGIAKEVDDGTQLILQAIISGATDASTAGTARIVGMCVSGLFMIARHGRDVALPRFTEMDIAFNRSSSLPLSRERLLTAAPDTVEEPK